MNKERKIDALILAGGKSSRMGGRHKGGLLYHGETLTDHMAGELRKRAETIYISYGRVVQEDAAAGIPVLDLYPDCGPMGGLHAGLRASSADFVLTAPCDMPLLTIDFYDYLLSLADGYDAVVPLCESRAEPLAAVYRPSCADYFEQQLQTGRYKLTLALDRMHVCYPDLSEHPHLAAMLVNINRPEDCGILTD